MTAVTEITARMAEIRSGIATLQALSRQQNGDFATALKRAQGTSGTSGTAGTTGTSATGKAGRTGKTATAAGSGYKGVTGQDVVAQARKYLGVPYLWGGTNPKVGLDCSGFIQLVYKKLGISLPRVSQDQAHEGRRVKSLKDAKPGDLLTFGNPATHIGLYVGNGKMMHAPHSGSVVHIVDLDKYYRKPTDIRRVLPDAAAAATSAGAKTSKASKTSGASGADVSAALRKVPYADLFIKAGQKYNISPALLAAVAKAESGFNPRAVSSAGARGLMQIMPGTAKGLGVNPMIPAQAVDGAARLLRSGLKEFGSVKLALAAYNAGAGAVHRYNGVPPYSETQNYVRRVQSYLTALK